MGISEQTFYRWSKQYGSLKPDQARELKRLQKENARLKKLVADLSLDKAILQDIAAKDGPARAEGAGPGLCPGHLRHQSASGLPTGSGIAKHALLRTPQGSPAGVATTHAGVGPYARALGLQAAARAVEPRGLGKPTDNSFVETFNGSLRDECLNVNWFASLAEAQGLQEAWRQDYNESRPHSALSELTPAEYARRIKEMGPAYWPRNRPELAPRVARRIQADQREPSS
ncbi:transposase [Roseateles asaccharophilus]|uniref:Transposase n=1 Tax=Roseateles asaccharophilus TaxID=582607 RepID=A0A4R6NBX8_9BURK|nr:transposase [Roseateles asaccharophilus]